jgi:hypothetical protein
MNFFNVCKFKDEVSAHSMGSWLETMMDYIFYFLNHPLLMMIGALQVNWIINFQIMNDEYLGGGLSTLLGQCKC